jgi:hypothetical protein
VNGLKRAQVAGESHRLVASRYPVIGIFDDLTSDPDELRVAFVLEAATNDRLTRRLAFLPDSEIVSGPGATLVMAAFLHADPAGGRFTDGRLGAWYAALEVETAIAETLHHNDRRLRLSAGGFPNRIQIRQLIAAVRCELVDLRGMRERRPELYRPDDYSASQAFGIRLRWPEGGEGEAGIVYDSVRREGGTNLCIFRPSLVRLPALQGDHFEYSWNNRGDATVMRLSNVAL